MKERELLVKLSYPYLKNNLLILLFGFTVSFAATVGEYGGAHLRMPVGSRAFAMGGAQSALPSSNLVWWNPALLSIMKERQIIIGGEIRPFGRTGGFITIEAPIKPRAGISATFLYRGDPVLDNLKDEQEYDLEDGSFTTVTAKIGLSYLITKKVSAGFNVSLFYQKLPTDYNGSNLVYSSVTKFGGVDIAVSYRPTKKLFYGLIAKQIFGSLKWSISREETGTFNHEVIDTLPIILTLAQQYNGKIKEYPFIWSTDISAYLINSNFKPLRHGHLLIDTGLEWQRWEALFLRFGIGDFELNSEIFKDDSNYGDYFSLNYTLGFGLNLEKFLKNKNLTVNYGIALDKVFAGLDQQLDVILKF